MATAILNIVDLYHSHPKILENQIFDCKFNSGPFEIPDKFKTFPRLIHTCASRSPNRRCIGTREFTADGKRGSYEWYSYQDVFQMVVLFAHGLKSLGYQKGDHIGIISPNRTEWTIIDFACATLGICLVPIYDTQSASDIEYVSKDADIKAVFCSLDRMHKVKHLDVKFYAFDDRLDDRIFLFSKKGQHKFAEKAKDVTLFAPRPFEVFDELDKAEGIYDPGIRNNQLKPVTIPANKNGYFPYFPQHLNQTVVDAFKTSFSQIQIKDEDITKISETFHSILNKGYEELNFKLSEDSKLQTITVQKFRDFMYEISEDEILSLVYTSGTTGRPKGVILAQKNTIWTGYVMVTSRVIPEANPRNRLNKPMTKRQEYGISYLPLAHIYMRALQVVTFVIDGALGYWSGATTELLNDIKELRITMFFLVPRIVQKIVEGITSKVEASGVIKRSLFKYALSKRQAQLQDFKREYNKAILAVYKGDKNAKGVIHERDAKKINLQRFSFSKRTNIVFKRFPELLGGRCRLFVTGSAPLSQAHGDFLVLCFNGYVFEGFGMTETSAHGAVQSIHTLNFGSIGEALENNTQLRLQSVPEMGYTISDKRRIELSGEIIETTCPRGELLIKGPTIFKGYWKDEEKTRESFTEDGFFKTGDIAEYNPVTKEVRLIDRKRGIVKLSQGEYISINQIEDAIQSSRYVEQVFLYANRFFPYLIAVVTLNESYCRTQGIISGQFTELKLSQEAIAKVSVDIRNVCKTAGLKGFEIPKVCVLETDPWTPENGLLTPAMKVKRPACKEQYEMICLDILHKIVKNEKLTSDQLALEVVKTLQEGPAEGLDAEGASTFTGMR